MQSIVLTATKSMSVFLRKYKGRRAGEIGLYLIVFFAILALLAPLLAPRNPLSSGPDLLQPPSTSHPLGTDNLGHDLYTQLIWGARVSLLIGLLSISLTLVIGIVIGSVSGYYGGWPDVILTQMTNILLVIPAFFLALIFVAMYGSSIWNIVLIIGLTYWPASARIIRSQFLSLREREFVLASRLLGAKARRIIFNEILPNALPPLISNSFLAIASAILLEASVSFLGMGDYNVASWGQMLYTGQQFLTQAWWIAFFPGLAISGMVLGFNLIGDRLNDIISLAPVEYRK